MRTPLANSCGRQMTVTHGTLLRRRFLRNDKACLTEAITFWGVFGCAASSLLRGSSLAAVLGRSLCQLPLLQSGLQVHGLQSLGIPGSGAQAQ